MCEACHPLVSIGRICRRQLQNTTHRIGLICRGSRVIWPHVHGSVWIPCSHVLFCGTTWKKQPLKLP
ncbi:hypothetical protein JOB18_033531 [Solea senegalensis]|uniref:Uncharacterized protein n=1 Tax=Solea senegalensis TaxID=28829 RepID=A0AAV6RU69_SOLSE|nr:hypothetical protein JOB18_033531 [Solea senegalensis]